MSASPKETNIKIKAYQGLLPRKAIGEVLVNQMISPVVCGPFQPLKGGPRFKYGLVRDVDPKSSVDLGIPPTILKILKKQMVGGIETEENQSFHFTTQTVIEIIDNGLSTVVFRELCDFLNISDRALAEVVKLPISTLAKRKKRGYFTSTESERIYRILNLYKQALDTFDGNEEYARKWLKEDAHGLGGVPPLKFAKTELGAKEVEQLLIRIDEGVFA